MGLCLYMPVLDFFEFVSTSSWIDAYVWQFATKLKKIFFFQPYLETVFLTNQKTDWSGYLTTFYLKGGKEKIMMQKGRKKGRF